MTEITKILNLHKDDFTRDVIAEVIPLAQALDPLNYKNIIREEVSNIHGAEAGQKIYEDLGTYL